MPTPHIARVTCDNPSPMTLDGTNTYVIGHQESGEAIVIDPGPHGHHRHLKAVLDAVEGRTVTEILVTHRHADHSGAAKELSARTGAPVRGHDAEQCVPVQGTVLPLMDGEEIPAGGLSMQVLHTPGHTSDSVCLWLPGGQLPEAQIPGTQKDGAAETGVMLTGDTILGAGTTMLDHPDGTLTDYLETLRLLGGFGDVGLLPAHGPERESLGEVAGQYLRHREERLQQTRELVAEHRSKTGLLLEPLELGQLIYGKRTAVPEKVIEQIAASQMDHLRHLGELPES